LCSVFLLSLGAGYKAIFVSVDLPVLGNRLNETRNNFAFPAHLRFPLLADDIEEYGLKDSYQRGYGKSSLVFSLSSMKMIFKTLISHQRPEYQLERIHSLAKKRNQYGNLVERR
jgi:isopentenyl diphosphate isomerase/L-lactate dehydrogenase-like FMN-dependent dehydrogenase